MNSKKQEKQTRYLSQALQLEEAVNPHIIVATMTVISLAMAGFLIWAGLTNINEVARTPGEVVPHGYQQIVQHLEGGMISAIYVQEGDVVEEGQVLVTLNDSSIREDLDRATGKQLSLDMQAERLRAFTAGREPDFSALSGLTEDMVSDQNSFFEGMRAAREKEEQIIRDQITQKKQAIDSLTSNLETAQQNLKIAEDIFQRREALNKKGYASDMKLLEDKKRLNDVKGEIKQLENQTLVATTEVEEFEARLASLSAGQLDDAHEKLDQILAEKDQNRNTINKLEERIGRLEIRAPVRGLIKGLSVNTIGAVVQPGQTIMEIVPLDKQFEVEVKISPKDVGHLLTGQIVQVKFSTYDFSRYGSVQGQLKRISATTFSGENGERYYQGLVVLNKNYVGNNPANMVLPGMTVMADVITGEKTILEYLLRPLQVAAQTAFTER